MSDPLALYQPRNLAELESMAERLSMSALIPDALRGKSGDVMATLLTGAELGLAPMQSLRSIVMIKGRPTMSAELMTALVRRRRDVCEYLTLVKTTNEVATYRAKRAGDAEPTEMSFTLQDAQRAGLINGDNWRKFPAAMLRARCASAICKAVFSDLLTGVYDSDSGELTDGAPQQEREVNAAPRARGLEAIPSVSEPRALPAPSPISEYGALATDELRTRVVEAEAWCLKNAKSKKLPEAQQRLAALQAELTLRDHRGTDEPPPISDEDAPPSEPGSQG